MRYTVVIPVLNAGDALAPLLDRLEGQTVPPEEIVVADSESDDGAARQAAADGRVRLISIRRKAFDHGGTRDLALRSCGTPAVVMMTQDAVPADSRCMEQLLKPMEDPAVAAVCARQAGRPDATPEEKAVRAFRYPEENAVWSGKERQDRGIRAFLLSDVCAAYRVSAYQAVGGFVHPLETNEDMLIAAAFLEAGYKLAYRGDAVVLHSHNYTLRQEYERNRKIGRFLAAYGDRFGNGGVTGEGIRLAKTVTGGLIREHHFCRILPFWLNCGARLLGNRKGKREGGGRTEG